MSAEVPSPSPPPAEPVPADVLRRVIAILATTVGADPARVRPEAKLVEYGLDSVKAIDLAIALEEAFGVEVPDQDAARMRTVEDVARYVHAKRGRA